MVEREAITVTMSVYFSIIFKSKCGVRPFCRYRNSNPKGAWLITKYDQAFGFTNISIYYTHYLLKCHPHLLKWLPLLIIPPHGIMKETKFANEVQLIINDIEILWHQHKTTVEDSCGKKSFSKDLIKKYIISILLLIVTFAV